MVWKRACYNSTLYSCQWLVNFFDTFPDIIAFIVLFFFCLFCPAAKLQSIRVMKTRLAIHRSSRSTLISDLAQPEIPRAPLNNGPFWRLIAGWVRWFISASAFLTLPTTFRWRERGAGAERNGWRMLELISEVDILVCLTVWANFLQTQTTFKKTTEHRAYL